jgi:hypothetical protein
MGTLINIAKDLIWILAEWAVILIVVCIIAFLISAVVNATTGN